MDWQQIFATRNARMKASEIRELLKLLDQPDIISFAGGIPDPALFPAGAFRRAYDDIFANGKAGEALQYSVSEGYGPLRDWLAGQMAGLGVACTRDNILITSGSQQALDYIGKIFLSAGDTAIVARPTYLGALGAFNAYEPAFAFWDPQSNRPAADYAAQAAAAGGRAKFAYMSVDFANPTGTTIDRAGRERLIDLADTLDMAVVEDAAYQSLRYDGAPVPPVLALEIARKGGIDACRTLYCGSFSKTLAPGLRVGWVVAARPVIAQMVLLKQAADLHSATINQIAITRVASEVFDSHVATLRSTYRERRDAMLAALQAHMPAGVTWTKPEGGMFIWVTLPEGADTTDLLARALAREKLAFVPGRAFHADGSGGNTLRLSFSLGTPDVIAAGIARLARVIAG